MNRRQLQAQVSSRKLEFTPRQLPVSQQQLFPASLRSTGMFAIAYTCSCCQ